MVKCGWIHCECGVVITDDQKKVKVGKRWFHESCAKERELINDIVTKFMEQVDPTANIPLLRKVVNDIIFNEARPAEYVMYALDYAIAHPQLKLMYPQGLYRICNEMDILQSWCKQQADKKVGSHKIDITEMEQPTLQINKSSGKQKMVSDLFS